MRNPDTPTTSLDCEVPADVDYITLSVKEQQLILQLQQDILEIVARGGDTLPTIIKICLNAERLLPNAIATVMLMDPTHGYLDVYAAPSISSQAINQLNGLKPGPTGGSCGNAVFKKQPQFVQNTYTDPRWEDLRQFAYDFEVRACWSMPIYAPQGKVIGSFALSSFEHRAPGNFHRKMLEICASIVGIILEREKAEKTLLLFGRTIADIDEGVMITDKDKYIITVNQAFTRILGYSLDEVVGKTPNILSSGIHDHDFYQSMWDHIDNHGYWHGEIWNQRKDGEIFPEWLSISAVRNAADELTHYIGIFSDTTDYHESQRKITEEHTLRQKIIEAIPAAFFLYDGSSQPVLTNQYWLEKLGVSNDDYLHSRLGDYVYEEDKPKFLAAAQSALTGQTIRTEFRSISSTGEVTPYLLNATGLMIKDQPHLLGIALDISENKRIEASLAHESQKNRFILRNASDGIHILNAQGHVLEASDAFCEMLGYKREELIGMNVIDWDTRIRPSTLEETLAKQIDDATRHQFETRYRCKNGTLIDVEVSGLSMLLEGQKVLFNSSRDITARKKAEAQTQYLAYHDPLTKLPNRALFLDHLSQSLASAQRTGRYGAVMFVDLDQFKLINDIHGHQVGDTVLYTMSDRLQNTLRQSDTIARFGGDEFVVLLPELGDTLESAAKSALTTGEKVRTTLSNPIKIDNQEYRVTASIGLSLFPKEGENGDDLIREADIAMFRAKEQGRNALILFEHNMQVAIAERYGLELQLREAISRDQLSLFMQSQVNKAGNITGAEVLLRWQHPGQGLLTPDQFIPIAEESGLIIRIGEWVLYEACRLLARLHASGGDYQVAVNISPRQFLQKDFVSQVKQALNETGANPHYLKFEITENLLIEPLETATSKMMALARLGIVFSIDDFGTGYSSLAYLKRLPLKEIKIDKGFIRDIPDDPNDVALVETMLSMADHLGFVVIAEGVETQKQVEFLSRLDCQYFQGFFFQQPLPSDQWLSEISPIPHQ